jgi:hypothetical protein
MSNKTVLKENLKPEETKASKPGVNQIDKKNIAPDKVAEKKQKKSPKKSSALLAGSMGRSAVDRVKTDSSRDVRGSSGLANTGTIISYD